MNLINRIKLFIKQVYRLSRNHEKHSEIVWLDLKKLHIDAGLKFRKDMVLLFIIWFMRIIFIAV